jgi:molecular chaperone DnaJ
MERKMRDPYSVLGVSPNATDEEIKKAYRRLSRKYHPDANINNPDKAAAEERFKEVQAAYDQIVKAKENHTSAYGYDDRSYNQGGAYGQNPFGGFGGFGSFGGFGGFGGYQSGRTTGQDAQTQHLNAAMDYLSHGYYKEAMNVLNDISEHSARWYYLHAMANRGLGNMVNAKEDAKMAHQLEPGNTEYAQFASAMENGTDWYADMGRVYGGQVYQSNECSSCLTEICCIKLMCGGCFC